MAEVKVQVEKLKRGDYILSVLDPPKRIVPLRSFLEVVRELAGCFHEWEALKALSRPDGNLEKALEDLYGPG